MSSFCKSFLVIASVRRDPSYSSQAMSASSKKLRMSDVADMGGRVPEEDVSVSFNSLFLHFIFTIFF